MKYVKLDPEAFQAKLNTVVRFWNDLEQRGRADNQASQELKDSCTYIFLRDDGWSIASPEFETAFKLWPEEWSNIYILDDPEHTLDYERIKQLASDTLENLQPETGSRSRSRWTGSKAEFMKMMDRQADASGQIISDADPGL